MTDQLRHDRIDLPDAVDGTELALLDRDGVVVSVNQAWTAFGADNGGDPTRVGVGVSYLDACHVGDDDDPTARLASRAVALAVAGRLPAPFRIIAPCHSAQERRWFEQMVASRFDDTGTCLGATVTFALVSADLRPPPVPAALVGESNSGASLPWRVGPAALPVLDPTAAWAMAELAPDGQMLFDERGRIVYVNLTLETLSGYSREELAGRAVEDLVPLLARPEHERLRADYQVAPSRRPMSAQVQARMLRRDGSEVEVDVGLAPVTVGGERLIACTVRDVGASREQERRLIETENYFGISFDESPVGMAVLEIDPSGAGHLVRVNEALAEILGVPAEELLGRDLADFRDPEDEPRRIAAVHSFVTGGVVQRDRVRQFARPDGTMVWASVIVSLVDGPGSGGATALMHVVDLTSHFEVELLQQRQQALTRLLVSATNDMLSGVPQNEVATRIVAAAAHVFDADSAEHFVVGKYGDMSLSGPVWRRNAWVADPPSAMDADVLAALDVEPGLTSGLSAFARYGRPGVPAGILVLTRGADGRPFTEPEVELLTSLAYQLGLTMELFESRSNQERLRLVEDRQRLARDLHDSVVQDIIGVGMQLNNGLGPLTEAAHRQRELELVDQLESAVDRLRAMLVHLRRTDDGPTLSHRVQEVIARVAPGLGHVPELVLTGEVDSVSKVVAEQVVYVVSEALSNVARHARAHETRVAVSADRREVRVSVDDDGVGLPEDLPAGHGLDNLRHRAESLDGEFSVRSRSAGGTSLRWRASVEAPGETMRRYRLDAASSWDVMMEAAADGVLTWVSPAVTDLLGWRPESLIGKSGRDLAHPDDAGIIEAAIGAADAGRIDRGTARMLCANGSYRWVRSVVRPVLDDSGRVLYRIVGVSAAQPEVETATPMGL